MFPTTALRLARFSLLKLTHHPSAVPINQFPVRNYSLEVPSIHADIVQHENQPRLDKLYRKIQLEWRGHDPAVLKSYTIFVKNVCHQLEIEKSAEAMSPYQRWLACMNKSKFAKKKYKIHYETRTHIRAIAVYHLTGSTASTFLEYIERNLPEGVGMKVTYTEMCPVPETIASVSPNGGSLEHR